MSDLREKILARILAGDKVSDISERFAVHRNTVTNIRRRYQATGLAKKGHSTGRPKSTRTADKIDEVREAINHNPETSIRKLARDHKMPETSMRELMKKDLGVKSLTKRKIQMLMPVQRQKRVTRGKKILNWLKEGHRGKVLVFSDEKDFHVDKYINRRNSRYISTSVKDAPPKIKYVGASKFPAKAMMLGVICSDGKALPPVWIKGNMDGPMYKNILSRKVFPVLDATYGKGGYVWTQDGASCHTSNVVQKYLKRRLGSKGFWSKEIWPPNSPNLNPLDFSVWAHVESRACHDPHPNVDSLKAAVNLQWSNLSKAYIRSCCSVFRKRVEAAIKAQGGAFEK